MRFEEIFLGHIRYMGSWLTIQIVKHQNNIDKPAKIYFKGPLQALQNMLKPDDNQNWENDIEKFSKEGIHAIGLAMMEILDVESD